MTPIVRIGPDAPEFAQLNMRRAGPLIVAKFMVPQSQRSTEPLFALIDTGASTTCLDESLAFALVPKSEWWATEVKDPITGTGKTHEIELRLCVPQINETTTLAVITAPLAAQGIHALLGRDFLADKVLMTMAGPGL